MARDEQRRNATTWPLGDGELATLMRAHDWAATSLGPLDAWPQSLRTAVDLMLASGFPAALALGTEAITLYNDGYRAIIGDRHPQALGSSIYDTFPELRPAYEPLLARVRQGETVTLADAPYPFARVAGDAAEDAWFTLTYSPLRDEVGRVVGVYTVVLDTTARVLAERRRDAVEADLRASEARFRLLGEALPQIVSLAEPDGRITYINPAWEAFSGRPADDFASGGWRDAVHPDDLPAMLAGWQGALAARQPYEYEFRARAADGSYRWLLARGRPVLGPDGAVAHWINAAVDIDDRKRAEAEAERNSHLFGRIAAASPSILYIFDLGERRNVYANDGVARILGYSPAEIAALGDALIPTLLHPDDRPVLREAGQRLATLGDGEVLTLDYRMRHANGGWRWLRGREVVFARDADGHPRQVLGLAADITAQRQAAEALRVSEERLQIAQAAGNVGVWDWDAATGETYWSPTMWALHGREPQPDRMDAGLWESSQHPDDRPRVEENLARFLASDETEYRQEFRIVQPNGTVRWIEAVASMIRDEAGAPLRMSGVNVDITARKEAEATLRASEARLRLATEAAGMYAWDHDPRAGTTTFSANTARIIGAPPPRTPEEITQCTHPDDRQRVAETGRRAIEEGRDHFDYEFRSVAAPGELRQFRVWCAIIRDVAGTPIRSVGITQDVTTTKRRAAHLAFLAEVGDDFAPAASADALMQRVGDKLGRHLGLSRCAFSIVDADADRITTIYDWRRDDDMPSIIGEHRISALLTDEGRRHYAAGKLAVIDDAHDNRLLRAPRELLIANRTAAMVDAPYLEDGRWRFLLTAARSQAGEWHADETELIRELAARIWTRLERARAEAALRQIEERQSFLLKLSDTLRPLGNATEVEREATRLLGETLGTDRVFYASIEADGDTGVIGSDYVRGIPSGVGRYSISAFAPEFVREWRAGRTTMTPDVNGDPRFTDAQRAAYASVSSRAAIGVPLVKGGQLVAVFGVNHSTPRAWTSEEIALVEETAERIWTQLERARAEAALRESEERLRLTTAAAGMYTFAIDPATLAVTYSANMPEVLGFALPDDTTGVAALLHPNDRAATVAILGQVFETRGEVDHEFRFVAPDDRREVWARVQGRFWEAADGATRFLGITQDITAHRRADEALRESEERQAFLLRLADALRPLRDAGAIQGATARLLREYFDVGWSYYCEFDASQTMIIVRQDATREGLPPMAGQHPFADMPEFLALWQAGQLVRVEDFWASPLLSQRAKDRYLAAGIRAFLGVPVLKDGHLIAALILADTERHAWSGRAIALTADSAERTWAAVERARAEEALTASEARAQALIANLPGGAVFVVDRDLRYRLAEGEALRTAGLRPADLLGKSVAEAAGPGRADDNVALYARALAGEPFTVEHEANGRTYLTRGVPLRAAGNGVDSVLALSFDITDRRAAEAALRASETRLQLALDATAMGTFVWHVAEDRGEPDPQMLALFGLPADGTLNLAAALATRLHPDDRERYAASVARAVEPHGTGELREDIRVLLPDGSLRWLSIMAQTSFIGTPRRADLMAGVAVDITERKEAEDALRASEERFRGFAENSADTLWIIDATTHRLEYLSPAFERMWGEPRDAVLADLGRWGEMVHPDDRALAATALPRALAGETGIAEYRIIRPSDGAIRWIRDTGFAVRDDTGAVVRAAGIAQDITDHMQIELALRESEMRFREFGAASSNVLWIRDAATMRFEYLSPAFAALYGADPAGLIGSDDDLADWAALLHPDDRDRARANVERARAGARMTHEFRVVRPTDGAVRWLRDATFPLVDGGGRIARIGGIALDVTDEIEMLATLEARVAERTAELRALSRQLLGVREEEQRHLSRELHDQIGQLLTGIRLTLAGAAEGADAAGAAAPVARAGAIVDELQRRVRALVLDLRPTALDDLGLLPALHDHLRRFAEQTGVRAELRHEGLGRRLPPEVETAAFRIVQEALTNVARHAETDAAIVQLMADDGWLTVQVRDAGRGSGPDDHAARESAGRAGMRERAEALGGTLTIDTAPGAGTAVTAELPLDTSEAPTAGEGERP